MDPLDQPAVALADLLARGEASSRELVAASLDRIAAADAAINAVVALDADAALAAADVIDATDWPAGERPAFAGVPMLVKDLNLAAGLPATFGTRTLADFVPAFDDEAVARMRRAGFVILGKTNVPEIGTLPVSESAVLGPCRNPWDLEYSAGGSSGGAAAAVAAGYLPLAQGSDGAGSIRIPSACCGLVGLKPTRGRVSSGPLFGEAAVGLSVVGPIARWTEDAAALLDVLAGYAVGDPHWAPPPATPFRDAVREDPPPLRIGVAAPLPWAPLDADAQAAVDAGVAALTRLGHTVEPVTLPIPNSVRGDFEILWYAMTAGSPIDSTTLEPFNAELARRGHATSAADFVKAEVALQFAARPIVGVCLSYDAVLAPVLCRTPLRVGELDGLDADPAMELLTAYVGLTPLVNVTGQPSIAVPLHVTAAGLPFGVQLIGHPAGEAPLLRLAAQLERATGWPQRKPAPAWLDAAPVG